MDKLHELNELKKYGLSVRTFNTLKRWCFNNKIPCYIEKLMCIPIQETRIYDFGPKSLEEYQKALGAWKKDHHQN